VNDGRDLFYILRTIYCRPTFGPPCIIAKNIEVQSSRTFLHEDHKMQWYKTEFIHRRGKSITSKETKGAHTRTSLASESGWARVPMSQTRPCVECHKPDLADSGLAPQGLRWGSARQPACYWLVRVWEVPSQTRVSTRPQNRQCKFCH
jgi:hypothetical protein